MLIVGFYFINKSVKSYGYSGVVDLIEVYNSNSALANQVEPQIMKLSLSDADYNFLKERRVVALDRGLQINDGNNYVPCSIFVGDEVSQGEMRLKGHMTDHLQGDKWSFRVKSENEIMGMYRFSLQHPGTRNYIYEWIYHQLLKEEGVIYLNYDFINLNLNDKDLGIYAIEEHFGQHVLDRNNRPKGAILRWNPSLYWEWRIDEFQGVYLDEDYSSYSSSYAEPYDKGVVLKDEELINSYQIAAYRLEKFRRGEMITSEVFDVEKMARFHAIIDLVGGHHSLDWSDVKFYYNSSTDKVEPVGYESFSIRKTNKIAGQTIVESYASIQGDYHAQLFSDPIFFEAYISNLERIASESYLKAFKDKIKNEFNEKIGIIAKEWPYRKFSFDGYFENIRLIRNNLELPKPFHAFVQSVNKDSVILSLAPVSDFPIEIIAIKTKKKEFKLDTPFILPPKARNTMIEYFEVTFNGKFKKGKDLILLAKIPGSSNVFNVEVAEYPSYKSWGEQNQEVIQNSDVDTNLFSINGNKICLKQKHSVVNKLIEVPKGKDLVLYPGQTLVLNNELVISGTLNSHGFSDDKSNIITSGKGKLTVYGELRATHTQFTGNNLISSNGAIIDLYKCQIYDVDSVFIKDFQSKITVNQCSIASVKTFGEFNETQSFISGSMFNKSELLFSANASHINLIECEVNMCNNISKLNYSSSFNLWTTKIIDSETMFELTNSSTITAFSATFSKFDVACSIVANDENLMGKASYFFHKTTTTNFNTLETNT